MTTRGYQRSFRWATIDQPGEYFRFAGDYLIEDSEGGERVWRVTGEDGERVYVVFDHEGA